MLEHVSGGELFDYLVRKGRLSEKEVKALFFLVPILVTLYFHRPGDSSDKLFLLLTSVTSTKSGEFSVDTYTHSLSECLYTN